MKVKQKIAVMAASCQPEQFHKSLIRMGLQKETSGKYVGFFDKRRQIQKIKRFSHSHHLRFLYDNEYGLRSSDYRINFFAANPTIFGKYRCVYCGRWFEKKKITIDHLYPVAKVSKNLKLQHKLAQQGIADINSLNNLVPACWKCNKKKSDKMGIWILRGKIGKSDTLWKIRWVVRFTILFLLILFVIMVVWYWIQYQSFPF